MLHLVKVESEGVSNWIVSDALRPNGLYSPRKSPGQNNGVDNLALLQGIFPTQGLNPALPHCRWFLYQLSHQGRPRILEWVAYPFSSRSSQSRNQTGVSCIAGGFFTSWAKSMSLALAGRLSTTGPPEKSPSLTPWMQPHERPWTQLSYFWIPDSQKHVLFEIVNAYYFKPLNLGIMCSIARDN